MNAPPAILQIAVNGEPVPQGSLSAVPSRRTGKAVLPQPPRLRAWRNTVAATARAWHRGGPLDEALLLRLVFVLRRPHSVPRRRVWPGVKPDLDKLVRGVCDALEGIVYTQDSRVVQVEAEKRYGERPGVLIGVWRA